LFDKFQEIVENCKVCTDGTLQCPGFGSGNNELGMMVTGGVNFMCDIEIFQNTGKCEPFTLDVFQLKPSQGSEFFQTGLHYTDVLSNFDPFDLLNLGGLSETCNDLSKQAKDLAQRVIDGDYIHSIFDAPDPVPCGGNDETCGDGGCCQGTDLVCSLVNTCICPPFTEHKGNNVCA